MFDLINGLPVHPLVVHGVVVLLPLTALATIALAIKPEWRQTYGKLAIAGAALSVALIPVATSSGESLEERVGDPGRHAELGETLIWIALPLLILLVAMVVLSKRRDEGNSTGASSSAVIGIVTALACVFAVGSVVQVYRIGDTGAEKVWKDKVANTVVTGEDRDGDDD